MSTETKALAALAALGLAGCALGLALDPKAMLASYLAAWLALMAVPVGAVGVLLTTYLVRGGWTHDLHAPLARAARTLPVTGLLFLPVLAGAPALYGWAAGAALPAFKAGYLALWFFAFRAVLYFCIWSAVALWALRAYGDRAAMTRAASAGLIAWTLTLSFAGIDWAESIEPEFHSSTYGLLMVSFALLGALAFAQGAMLAGRRPPRMGIAAHSALLLSVLLLWSYLHAMQYIIIWAGNLPDETTWYLARRAGGWGAVLWLLFLAQAVVPFFLLLSERARANRMLLLALTLVTVALRYVEAAVLILPPLGLSAGALALDLPAAALATGAIWWLAWRGTEKRVARQAAQA